MSEKKQVLIDAEIMKLYWKAPDEVKETLRNVYGPGVFGEMDENRVYWKVIKTLVEEVLTTPNQKMTWIFNHENKDIEMCITIRRPGTADEPPDGLVGEQRREANYWDAIIGMVKKSLGK